MDELKDRIAKKLIELRQSAGLTQLQLAEKLNYSDKAVSKWERGEAIPDIRVLIRLAEMYHIKVDDIINATPNQETKPKMNVTTKRIIITSLSVGLVWFVATLVFATVFFISKISQYAWLSFIAATLPTAIVLTVFSAIWGNRITNTVSISLIGWMVIVIVHLFLFNFACDFLNLGRVMVLYSIGGAFEVLVILYFFVLRKFYKKKNQS